MNAHLQKKHTVKEAQSIYFICVYAQNNCIDKETTTKSFQFGFFVSRSAETANINSVVTVGSQSTLTELHCNKVIGFQLVCIRILHAYIVATGMYYTLWSVIVVAIKTSRLCHYSQGIIAFELPMP